MDKKLETWFKAILKFKLFFIELELDENGDFKYNFRSFDYYGNDATFYKDKECRYMLNTRWRDPVEIKSIEDLYDAHKWGSSDYCPSVEWSQFLDYYYEHSKELNEL